MASDYIDSHTPIDIRDLWQTPRWLFETALHGEEFAVDIASSHLNHLCRDFITKEQDALSFNYEPYRGKGAWCNPPYSNIKPWVELAINNQSKYEMGTVLLLPADTSVGWFDLIVNSADDVCFITKGRISFVRADTQEPVDGNPKGSMLVYYKPESTGRLKTHYINREYFMEEGFL